LDWLTEANLWENMEVTAQRNLQDDVFGAAGRRQ